MNLHATSSAGVSLRLLLGLLLLGCALAIVVQWNATSKLRAENQRLREQAQQTQAQAGESDELQRLRAENQEVDRLRKDNRELLRLRNEIRQLRDQTKELTKLQAQNQALRTELQTRATQPVVLPAPDADALTKAGERAESIQCVNNLKQIGLAGRIWANDHNGVLPSDFLTVRNELSTPKVLVCPSDKAKVAAATWNEFNPASTLSYEIVSPGVKETEPQKVFVLCPRHGHVCLADGSVQMEAVKKQP
jgi:hypothetical protein